MTELPRPVGPYELVRRAGDFLFVSGQIGLRSDGELERSSVEAEARQVLVNIQKVLEAWGASLSDVVDVTIFLTDMEFFPVVNRVYEEFFTPPYPARKTVSVKQLPLNARIEISVVAWLPQQVTGS